LHSNLFIEPNPMPTKWALAKMGFMRAECRLPLVALTEKGAIAVADACAQAGIQL
jgi:4-hydroxy-tetrahydrodipicolinate synthase